MKSRTGFIAEDIGRTLFDAFPGDHSFVLVVFAKSKEGELYVVSNAAPPDVVAALRQGTDLSVSVMQGARTSGDMPS